MYSQDVRVPAETTQEEALDLVRAMNADPASTVFCSASAAETHRRKRGDRRHRARKGRGRVHAGQRRRMVIGETVFVPAPARHHQMLLKAGVQTSGKHAVWSAAAISSANPSPISDAQSRRRQCTVTVCHTGTRDLAAFTRQADILVVAAGRPNTVTGDMVKPAPS
jgi:methylenetetrahydrofolate dehydrogenase (NADP+)/methenyltetrahydrofolate cyclohydrolase